ncbi:MAG TPA: DUF4388 domain-containing protein [Thermoanaerobaculia bacterium]
MTDRPASPPRIQFRGDLAQNPLAEILATIHHYRAPGFLECARAGEIKRIFIDEGNIVFATSTSVLDSLGDRLLNQGKITREQYDESVVRLQREVNKRQGVILVEMGALQPKELFVSVRDQVLAIVWSIFTWEEGPVFFEPGRDKRMEFIKLNIPARQAVLRGVRRMPHDPKSLIARIGTRTTLFKKNPNADFADIKFSADEEDLWDRIDGRTPLVELTKAKSLAPAESAKILYAFFVLRLVTIHAPKQVKVKVKTNR